MSKVQLSRTELDAHLKEQLAFLERSADAYDEGFSGEAKRIAVTVRVLMHDTTVSHSLLGQLGSLDSSFLSTALPHSSSNVATHGGLVFIAARGRESQYVAMLDGGPYSTWLPFDEWWRQPIFVDDRRAVLSRRDLVLTASNQDGGAHVDPALDETYRRLAKENSLLWSFVDETGQHPIPFPERAALRQIGHEVLRTLRPDYSKKIEIEADILFGGAMLENAQRPTPLPRPERPGRNDPCPCGSGRKYKKCHGAVT